MNMWETEHASVKLPCNQYNRDPFKPPNYDINNAYKTVLCLYAHQNLYLATIALISLSIFKFTNLLQYVAKLMSMMFF